MILDSGWWAGHDIRWVASGYLWWVVRNVERLEPWQKREIAAELESRHLEAACQYRPREESRRQFEAQIDPVPEPSLVDRWYRQLTLKWHPDRGGSTQAMQVINHAHTLLREMLKKG
jgi:hypothetical protein